MTAQEPPTQHLTGPALPDTEVILVDRVAPVFVDSTGRRRRLLRRFSYALGAFCIAYGAVIGVSLAGGPVNPHTVLPLPELIGGAGQPPAATPPTTPQPTATAPNTVLVNDAASRRTDGRNGSTRSRPDARQRPATTRRPSAGPAARVVPAPTMGRPTEAATVATRPSVPAPPVASQPTRTGVPTPTATAVDGEKPTGTTTRQPEATTGPR